MILSGFLIFAGEDVIAILIGSEWSTAGQLLNILSFALIGSGASQMTGMLYQSQRRIKHFQQWGLIDSAVRISSIVIGGNWGLYGMAIGFVVSTTLITAPMSLWFVGRIGPVTLRDQLETLKPGLTACALGAAGTFVGGYLTRNYQPGIIALSAKIGGMLVGVLLLGLLIPSLRRALSEVLSGILESISSKVNTGSSPPPPPRSKAFLDE
jgi:O-antigen/teichoic acid export membrane protein